MLWKWKKKKVKSCESLVVSNKSLLIPVGKSGDQEKQRLLRDRQSHNFLPLESGIYYGYSWVLLPYFL